MSWCHRMKNTRDHAEIPELMEVLGLDGQGQPVARQETVVQSTWGAKRVPA